MISRWWVVLTLAMLGCKDTASAPEKTEADPKPLVARAAGPFEKVWTQVEGTKSACPDYDYFPNGGMRNVSCHLKTIISYTALQALAPKIWRAGPHTTEALALDVSNDFGRYDPAFVRWLVDNAIPGAENTAFRSATQGVYDRAFKSLARTYLRALLHFERDPAFRDEAVAFLENYITEPDEWERPLDRLARREPDDMVNLYAPALAFWTRRNVDGTAKLFEEGLRRLITTYDATAFEEVAAMPIPGGLPEPPLDTSKTKVADGPIDAMVAAAWRGLADAPFGCPDQFQYEPGGVRIVYCFVKPLIDFATLAEKVGFPIFRSGPHGDGLELGAERDFGRYDPRFVRWLVDNAVPAAKDSALRAATQRAYDERLRIPARAYYAAKLALTGDPKFAAEQKAAYQKYLRDGGDKPFWGYWERMPGIYEAQAIGGTGIAFWLRRSMDGTDATFAEGLEKLLKTYDRTFYETATRIGFDGLKSRDDLFGAEPDGDLR